MLTSLSPSPVVPSQESISVNNASANKTGHLPKRPHRRGKAHLRSYALPGGVHNDKSPTGVSLFKTLARIDGLQEADPSSRAGGTLLEFQKCVPNHVHCWVTQ